MTLLIPRHVYGQLLEALRAGGRREIGGILMGEHVGVDTFRLVELSTQMHGGTFARFVRFVEAVIKPLREFFKATNHDYERFNYLGEWHSHHSFALEPSGPDHETMREIVQDDDVGARFAVLLLVKLSSAGELEYGLTLYEPGKPPAAALVVIES
jgi:hypothetical protein